MLDQLDLSTVCAVALDIARRAGLRHLVAGLQRIDDLRPGR